MFLTRNREDRAAYTVAFRRDLKFSYISRLSKIKDEEASQGSGLVLGFQVWYFADAKRQLLTPGAELMPRPYRLQFPGAIYQDRHSR